MKFSAANLPPFTLLPLSLCLLSGCVTSESDTLNAAQPAASASGQNYSAAISLPPDSPQFLYAIGYGNSPDLARRDALQKVVEKLSLEVSSVYEQTIEETTGQGATFSETARLRMRQEVGGVHLNHHEVIQTSRSGNQHLALVRVDRQRMIAGTQSRRDILSTQLDSMLAQSPDPVNTYAFLNHAGRIASTAEQLRRSALLLIALGQHARDQDLAFTRAARGEAHFRTAWSGQIVLLNADAHSQDLQRIIQQALRTAGIDVRLRMSPIPPETLVVRIRGFNRISSHPDGYQSQLTQEISVRIGNTTYFDQEWQTSATAPLRDQARQAAVENILLDVVDVDGLAFLGW